MTNSRAWLAAILILSFGLSSCILTQSNIETAVARTLQISQLETAAAAVGSQTAPIVEMSTETLAPTDTVASPAETAPDPLPASTTGVVLNNGECFNFDAGQVTAPDAECDMWLVEPALIRQMNGAQISGYVTLTAPARTQCVQGHYETGDLALQTDLYMCFITNQGRVGFVVVRSYLGAVPFTGVAFDYWVFE